MLSRFLSTFIQQELPFTPNAGQEALIAKLGTFLVSSEARRVFVLQGYAGTGKTSMVSALVRSFDRLRQNCVLLAPTGRAAKVLSAYSGKPAYTIHKKIYRQRQMGVEQFGLTDNLHKHTLFIVDEASMLSGQKQFDSPFGSGNLLDDLIRYVFSGDNCSLLLLGDTAQLPPVGSPESPALNPDVLAGYGLTVFQHTLTEVARQALDSGILRDATRIRQVLNEEVDFEEMMPVEEDEKTAEKVPSVLDFLLAEAPDICRLSPGNFLETLEDSYNEVGQEETLILTRTNKRTNLYNQSVRNRVLWFEDEITGGDRLMVTKNNYFWTEEYENLDFLANGDMFDVVRVHNFREMYGFRFADASLRAIDYDYEIDVTLWLDTLTTDSPEANFELQKKLWQRVAEDYPEIRNKRDLWQAVMKSPYYNALQVRFAYAVTCHKAQGGQWKRVFIDPGFIDDEMAEMLTSHPDDFEDLAYLLQEASYDPQRVDFLRWLYTALTRAREQVYLVGFPGAQEDM